MRQYERSGVTVDQCLECRGIFLDRGELERLVDAEQTWNRGRPPQQPTHQHGGYGHYGHHKKHRRDRRESFFGELFD